MAMIQKAAEHLMPASTVKAVVSMVFGTFVCGWLLSCVLRSEVLPPLRLVNDVAQYLGVDNVGRFVTPVERWCAKPERHPLFVFIAFIGALLFNLSASRVVFSKTAADFAWLFTLVAVQGIGARDVAIICGALSLGLFLLAYIYERGFQHAQTMGQTWCAHVLGRNFVAAFFVATMPVFVLVSWVFSIYARHSKRGERDN